MLFNSYQFLFGFLPLTLAGYFFWGRYRPAWAMPWLALASVFFYAYWDWRFVPLFVVSVAINYAFGRRLLACDEGNRRRLLVVAVLANLALLGYYKYFNFFLAQLDGLFGLRIADATGWVLPLGISFFTFTQIAYLVDVSKGEIKETSFSHYLLFVSYFPHLIAGPVLHHSQMMPQFANREVYTPRAEHMALGVTVFTIGLAKKVLLADTLAGFVSPVFSAAAGGGAPSFVEAWTGVLAYTLQLYFDFSGYSDMAIGASLLFNIRLPLNFYSPYRAVNIIDFWRRWHMTLSQFLRDYLYIPLGGGRKGKARRYINLMLTMLLGGLWHGAGWTFVLWGGLHGLFLMVNHAWRALVRGTAIERLGQRGALRFVYTAITFFSVVAGWVLFRSDTLAGAMRLFTSMSGVDGVAFDHATELLQLPLQQAWTMIVGGLLIVFLMPNSVQWLAEVKLSADKPPVTSGFPSFLVWQGRRYEAWFVGSLLALSILSLTRVSEFLYFQF
jgi:alginate O-acetyltransferase complex protein AlgI